MSWEVIVVLGLFISISIIYTMYDKHKGNKTLEQEIAELKEKSEIDLEEANKRKRLELLEKFKQITETENELNDLLFGYRDNDIIFNLDSLINYLNDKEIRAFIETLYPVDSNGYPVDSNGSNIKLTINFSATRYTVFIKVYNSNTKTVKITEVLRNLK